MVFVGVGVAVLVGEADGLLTDGDAERVGAALEEPPVLPDPVDEPLVPPEPDTGPQNTLSGRYWRSALGAAGSIAEHAAEASAYAFARALAPSSVGWMPVASGLRMPGWTPHGVQRRPAVSGRKARVYWCLRRVRVGPASGWLPKNPALSLAMCRASPASIRFRPERNRKTMAWRIGRPLGSGWTPVRTLGSTTASIPRPIARVVFHTPLPSISNSYPREMVSVSAKTVRRTLSHRTRRVTRHWPVRLPVASTGCG